MESKTLANPFGVNHAKGSPPGGVANLPGVLTGLLPPVDRRQQEAPHEAVRRDQAAGLIAERRAYEMLASAACYLSLGPGTSLGDTLESVATLVGAAEMVRDEGALLSELTIEADELIWYRKQLKWESLWSMTAADSAKRKRKPLLWFLRRR